MESLTLFTVERKIVHGRYNGLHCTEENADEKHIEAEGDPRVLDDGLSLCPCVIPSIPRLITLTEVRTLVLLAPTTTNLESQAGWLMCIRQCAYLPMVSVPCYDE